MSKSINQVLLAGNVGKEPEEALRLQPFLLPHLLADTKNKMEQMSQKKPNGIAL